MQPQENRGASVFHLGLALALVAGNVAPLPLSAPVAGVLGVAPVQAQHNSNQWNNDRRTQQINCYSSGNKARSCALPANAQSVRYVGPDRSNKCREGDTWKRSGNNLRVSGGCGGVFEVVTFGGNQGGNQGGGNNNGRPPGHNGSNNNGWGNNGGGFAGEITCRSNNNRQQECSARTNGRVQLLQQYSNSPCIEGSSWRYTNSQIIVRNGCQARFGYGHGNVNGGGNNQWNSNSGFANQIECRSENNRHKRCAVNTQSRVEMLRQLSNSSCTQGRSWGYDRNSIWVDNGCQARFGYGYGNVSGDHSDGKGGSNTGAVIGGVALAAGLVALLASSGKGKSSQEQSASSQLARVDADLSRFPSAARTAGDLCLKEAARQVGATGGSSIRLDSVDRAERSGDEWMILGRLTATYSNSNQVMNMDCRASNSRVTGFDIR